MNESIHDPMYDPFAVLGVAWGFSLDLRELHKLFIQAVGLHHPDRFQDPLDQADAAERAAQVNEAYAVLLDPEQRANVLLRLLGGATKEEDTSLPPALLGEMMQVREDMEEAIDSHDEDKLDQLRQWAGDERQQHLKKVGDLFAIAEAKPREARQGELKAIRLELNAMRYIERMLEQMPDEDEPRK